jgi:hypothetical protein
MPSKLFYILYKLLFLLLSKLLLCKNLLLIQTRLIPLHAR